MLFIRRLVTTEKIRPRVDTVQHFSGAIETLKIAIIAGGHHISDVILIT